ncbi:inactive rhomboid protein 1-like isoform X2 [Dreissena polymorpha]|uniref:inactive rhomboid protein 1-like isoform X2 n=1 Tax=Dreissena polymorpha TaxID=45954 RepID=UPI002264C0EB|nr:inactive rhomboid protein 1-like isoform X2 [Dreissena polymorpha]
MEESDNPRKKNIKLEKLKRYVKVGVLDFFGLGQEDSLEAPKWQNRRKRFYKGQVKDDGLPSASDFADAAYFVPRVPVQRVRAYTGVEAGEDEPDTSVQPAADTEPIMGFPRCRTRKDSVLQMTFKAMNKFVSGGKKYRSRQRVLGRDTTVEHQASIKPSDAVDSAHIQVAGPSIEKIESRELEMSRMETGQYRVQKIPYVSGQARSYLPQALLKEIPPDQAQSKKDILADNFYDITPPSSPRRHVARRVVREGAGLDEADNVDIRGIEDEADAFEIPDFLMMREIRADIKSSFIEKRRPGMSVIGRLCLRKYKDQRGSKAPVMQDKVVDELYDHRPFFTCWMTFVQVVIFIVSVSVYGFAPVGINDKAESMAVLKPNLAIENSRQLEPRNLWIGPRQAALVHLGAKYSPCMRKDEGILKGILLDRAVEKDSACCVRDDGSGCFQALEGQCPKKLSTWNKWSAADKRDGKWSYGSVCGQDPRYCTDPASVDPFVWDNDISKWPLCKKKLEAQKDDIHMMCNITGRPCCHGIQGECMITTREHCDFVRGYFHDDAFLCSQVQCMKDVCGMIPFGNDEKPDQFYRLWTSLFLHGGFFHLVITVIFQIIVCRDLEKLIGTKRMIFVYMFAGISGNLASCIFVPYHVEKVTTRLYFDQRVQRCACDVPILASMNL